MKGETRPLVAMPPRQLPVSTISVRAPMRAAAMAAQTPAGPPPAMRMSVSYWVGIPLLLRVVPVQAEARPGRVPAAASIPAADRKSRLFISLAWLKLYSFQYIRCEYRKNLQKYKHRFSPAQSLPRSAPSPSPENVCQDVSLSASSGPPRPSRAACRAALPCYRGPARHQRPPPALSPRSPRFAGTP